jgi:hypothetical protein
MLSTHNAERLWRLRAELEGDGRVTDKGRRMVLLLALRVLLPLLLLKRWPAEGSEGLERRVRVREGGKRWRVQRREGTRHVEGCRR